MLERLRAIDKNRHETVVRHRQDGAVQGEPVEEAGVVSLQLIENALRLGIGRRIVQERVMLAVLNLELAQPLAPAGGGIRAAGPTLQSRMNLLEWSHCGQLWV